MATIISQKIPYRNLLGKDVFPTALMIILGNLVPMLGVIFLGWNAFSVFILFWFESLIIGLFNILKMLASGFSGESKSSGIIQGLFFSAFFSFHYGMFMFVHLIFLLALGSMGGMGGPGFNGDPVGIIFSIIKNPTILFGNPFVSLADFFSSMLFGVLAIFIYTAMSFINIFIGKKQYEKKSPMEIMGEPYGRIVLMHLTILIGGFLIISTKAPVGMLAFFIVYKIFLDLRYLVKTLDTSKPSPNKNTDAFLKMLDMFKKKK